MKKIRAFHIGDQSIPGRLLKTVLLFSFLVSGILSSLVHPVAPAQQEKEVLKIGVYNFPNSLNPVYCTDEVSQAIVNKVFESLFYYDCYGKMRNGLVESYSYLPGEKAIFITLKKNHFFPDGKELDAGDVVATYRIISDGRYKSPRISELDFIRAIEQTGKYRLKLSLHYSTAAWKSRMTFKILHAGKPGNYLRRGFRNKLLSGTGAYRLKEIKKPSTIILDLNPGGNVDGMYKTIRYEVVNDTRIVPLKLVRGELDICELLPEQKDIYDKVETWQKAFRILEYQKFGYTFLVFNMAREKISKNVRRIFYNHLVCGDFVRRFLKGKGEKVKSPFLLLNDKVTCERLETEPRENPLRLKVLVNSGGGVRQDFIRFLAKEMKVSNIHLDIMFLEYHTFLKYLKRSNFDLALSGYILTIDHDMKDIFGSRSYFNYARFKSARMDGLLEEGLREPDEAKREEIYYKAHRVWLDELPLLPLFNLYYYVGVSRRIKVPKTTSKLVSSEGDFLFNIDQWKVR